MAATGDQHTDACPGRESVRDRVQVQADVVGRVGQLPVAVADILGAALGVDFADPAENFDGRVFGAVCQLGDGVAVHVQIIGKHVAGEAEHIAASHQLGVVAVTGVGGQQSSPDRGG